jgi:TolA-binding protein
MTKRSYTRRSDEQRIAELEQRLSKIKGRVADKQQRESPIQRDVKKVQRVLRKFAQTALDHGRADLANSTTAFLAGLERLAGERADEPARGRAARNGG